MRTRYDREASAHLQRDHVRITRFSQTLVVVQIARLQLRIRGECPSHIPIEILF